MGMSTALHEDPQDTWIGMNRFAYCTPADAPDNVPDDAAHPLPGGLRLCPDLSLGSFYIACFSWSLMVLTGTGGTDIYPNVQSDAETVVVGAMVLIGVLLWAYVLSQFCDMATNSSPGNTEFKQLLDGLNEYFDARDVPRSMHRRLR